MTTTTTMNTTMTTTNQIPEDIKDLKADAQNEKYLLVELYLVPDAETLEPIDSLEGHPNWYVRTPVKTLTGDIVEVYNMEQTEIEGYHVNTEETYLIHTDENNNKFFNWTK